MRLLIAEDNKDMIRALTALLIHDGYSVDSVENGDDACSYALEGGYDGILLDIMMPGMDGLTVLRTLRSAGIKTPVLLLTARGETEDRVNGLDAGADDYLPKPFAASELLARIRAMLRRRETYRSDTLEFEGLSLNPSTFELSCGSRSIRLVNREFQMLQLLMQAPGTIIPTDHFMERIWGWESNVEVSIVWVYVSNLRKKIHSLGASVQIRAMRGVGYCLEKKQEKPL